MLYDVGTDDLRTGGGDIFQCCGGTESIEQKGTKENQECTIGDYSNFMSSTYLEIAKNLFSSQRLHALGLKTVFPETQKVV